MPVGDDSPEGLCGVCLFAAANSATEIKTHSPDFPKIQGFEIIGRLGEGDMGHVWLAYVPEIDRALAVKLFRHSPSSANSRWTANLQHELNIASGLHHPALATLFHSVTASDGTTGFAMEWIDGVTLEEWIDTHPKFPLEARLELFEEIVGGVSYLHEHGVIHRDLKPTNILVAQGHAKIVDFGLARVQSESTQSVSGSAVGTLHFMAPEQAANGPGSRATPVDVYALGLVLYWLVTGEWFVCKQGNQAETLAIVLHPPPCRPRLCVPSLSRDLDAIIRKSLEPNPALRYRTAGDLLADLQRFKQKRPVSARKLTLRYVMLTFLRRQAKRSLLAAVITLLGIAGSGWIFYHHRRVAVRNEANLRAAYVLMDFNLRKLRDELRSLSPPIDQTNYVFERASATTDTPVPVNADGQLDLRYSNAMMADIHSSVLEGRGLTADALKTIRQALDLFSELANESPQNTNRLLDAAMARLNFARLLDKTGNYKGSAEHVRKTLRQIEVLRNQLMVAPEELAATRCDCLRLQAQQAHRLGNSAEAVQLSFSMLAACDALPPGLLVRTEIEEMPRLALAAVDLGLHANADPELLHKVIPAIAAAMQRLRTAWSAKENSPSLKRGLLVTLHASVNARLILNPETDFRSEFSEMLNLLNAMPRDAESTTRPIAHGILQTISQSVEYHLQDSDATIPTRCIDLGHAVVNHLRGRGDDSLTPLVERGRFYYFQSRLMTRANTPQEAARKLRLALITLRERQVRYPSNTDLALLTARCLHDAHRMKNEPEMRWNNDYSRDLQRIVAQLNGRISTLTIEEKAALQVIQSIP